MAIVAGAVLTGAGCVSQPEERPYDKIEGTSMHLQSVREKMWKDLCQEKEKELHERMGEPSEPKQ